MSCDVYLPNMFIKADTVKGSEVKPFFCGTGHTLKKQDFIAECVGSAQNLQT